MIIGMSMKIYYKKDIVEIIDRPLRTVTQWIDSGFIVPDVEDSRGKGKARIFSESNVIEFAMFDIMSRMMDFHQGKIKYILDHLKGLKYDGFRPEVAYDDIKDFYTSKAWGVSKEIYFFNGTLYHKKGKKLTKYGAEFEIVKGEENISEGEVMSYHFPVSLPTDYFAHSQPDHLEDEGMTKLSTMMIDTVFIESSILWLGALKNIAIKHFNITV